MAYNTALCTQNIVKRVNLMIRVLTTVFKEGGENLDEVFREPRHRSHEALLFSVLHLVMPRGW